MNTAAVGEAFRGNFASGREAGAAVSIWQNGREIVALHAGTRDAGRAMPWEEDTLCLVWSATKGIAAACVLHVLARHGLGLNERVGTVWPEFACNGKEQTTLGELLSHGAGLAVLENPRIPVFDHEAVVSALATQSPHAGVPAYGPRTWGFLMDELVRRLEGCPLGTHWRRTFADPLGLDFWIGLPPELDARVATMLAPRSVGEGDPFLEAFQKPDSLTRRAFAGPSGLASPSQMNEPRVRQASLPSMGGIGTARALARFYGLLASGGGGFFDAATLREMHTIRTQGVDAVLRHEVAFSTGLMMDPTDAVGRKLRTMMGPSPRAFGHPGAGGSLAFADPENGIGFAYVMNQMEPGVLPGGRALRLVRALYGLPPGEEQ